MKNQGFKLGSNELTLDDVLDFSDFDRWGIVNVTIETKGKTFEIMLEVTDDNEVILHGYNLITK